MDYIREAKEVLIHYSDLKFATKNLQDRLETLREDLRSCAPISWSDMPHANCSGEEPDDNMLNTIFERDRTAELLEESLIKLKKLEEILNNLPKEYKKVLIKSYSQEMMDTDLTKELHMSRSKLFEIRNKAIRKLAIQYFGIEAI